MIVGNLSTDDINYAVFFQKLRKEVFLSIGRYKMQPFDTGFLKKVSENVWVIVKFVDGYLSVSWIKVFWNSTDVFCFANRKLNIAICLFIR